MRKALRWRFWLETVMAIITGVLFVITLIRNDWIEAVFGIDPDNRSGTLEWLIIAALLVVTITIHQGLLGSPTKFTTLRPVEPLRLRSQGRYLLQKNCFLALSFISASSQDQLR